MASAARSPPSQRSAAHAACVWGAAARLLVSERGERVAFSAATHANSSFQTKRSASRLIAASLAEPGRAQPLMLSMQTKRHQET
eukprot:499762-Pleurochrysis_carterae.AAC.2